MNHLWQRFLLASSLLVGLAVGVAATVFGYSNLATVDVHWSVFHIDGIPLWTVALVPIALILVAGTLYHWIDSLHHFTEHMRHRGRVHELEAEVARLRAHLDQVLEMPRQDAAELPASREVQVSLPAADLAATDLAMKEVEPAGDEPPSASSEPADTDAEQTTASRKRAAERGKRARLTLEPKPESDAAPEHTNGADSEPAVQAQDA